MLDQLIEADPTVAVVIGLLVVSVVLYVVFGMVRLTRGRDSDGARIRRRFGARKRGRSGGPMCRLVSQDDSYVGTTLTTVFRKRSGTIPGRRSRTDS